MSKQLPIGALVAGLLTLLLTACGAPPAPTVTAVPPTPVETVRFDSVGLEVQVPEGWVYCAGCVHDTNYEMVLYRAADYPNGLTALPTPLDATTSGPFLLLTAVGADTALAQAARATEADKVLTGSRGLEWNTSEEACQLANTALDSGYVVLISTYGTKDIPAQCAAVGTVAGTAGYYQPVTPSTPSEHDGSAFYQMFSAAFRGVIDTL